MTIHMRFPGGLRKALTFSYDDAVEQDIRLVDIFDKHGLKGTFNINTGSFSPEGKVHPEGQVHRRMTEKQTYDLLANSPHEVAVHTLTHPFLPDIEDEKEIIRQVEKDRENLSDLAGYEVIGMAYPCGGENNDDRVAKIIKENTGVKFSRTITSNYSFDIQNNLYRFNPTVYGTAAHDKMVELGKKFIELTPDKPQIFYIWGHAYEFDIDDTWDKFESFCEMISGKDDIFYGSNKEILL